MTSEDYLESNNSEMFRRKVAKHEDSTRFYRFCVSSPIFLDIAVTNASVNELKKKIYHLANPLR